MGREDAHGSLKTDTIQRYQEPSESISRRLPGTKNKPLVLLYSLYSGLGIWFMLVYGVAAFSVDITGEGYHQVVNLEVESGLPVDACRYIATGPEFAFLIPGGVCLDKDQITNQSKKVDITFIGNRSLLGSTIENASTVSDRATRHVKSPVNRNESSNTTSIAMNKSLHSAISRLDKEEVRRLLAKGADIHSGVFRDYPVTVLVAMNSRGRTQDAVEIIDLMLAHGADINAKFEKRNALDVALRMSNTTLGRELLVRNIEVSNFYKVSDFIRHGRYESALLLLEGGAVVDFNDYSLWRGIKHLAVIIERGHEDSTHAITLYRRLLDKRPIIDLSQKKGRVIHAIYQELLEKNNSVILNGISKVKFINNYAHNQSDYRSQRNLEMSPEHGSPEQGQYAPISIGKPQFSKSAVVHAVGIYEGASDKDEQPWWSKCGVTNSDTEATRKAKMRDCHRRHAGKRTEREVEIYIGDTSGEIILVLMAYEPVHWRITSGSNSRISAIILGGYYSQRASGISSQTPVYAYTHESSTCHRCIKQNDAFFAYKRDDKRYHSAMSKIKEITGQYPASFQNAYRGRSFYIRN